jgi:hypothetical protein
VTLYLGLVAYASKGTSDLRKSFLYLVADKAKVMLSASSNDEQGNGELTVKCDLDSFGL